MPDVKISALTSASTPLSGTEVLPIVQSSATVKVSIADVTAGRAVSATSIAAGLGAVGTPAYTFTGDANTGMWSPAADTIAFSEGGAEAMRIDSSGNVGIGTSAPVQRLHARQDQDGTTAALIQNRNGTGSPVAAVQFISGGFDLSDNRYAMLASDGGSTNTLQFWTGQGATPTEKMRITSAGNVGINEAAPDYRLDVNGTFGFTPGASVTPVDNGDVVFELTSNTTLTVKAKGSDGVVRSVALTLA